MVKKFQTWLSIRKANDIALAVSLPLAAYFWLDVPQLIYAVIITIIVVLLITSDIFVIKHVNKLRRQIETTAEARDGHQGEPNSWQCSCGRYNTDYRSICLSCGKPRPGVRID